MITADQIVLHLVGDYVIQSDWMARNKVSKSYVALIHAVTYTIPFLIVTHNWLAPLMIAASHFVIDRWRLARFVVWIKNGPWLPLTKTGYQEDVPAWLAVWLLIIVDNTMHLIINGIVLSLTA